MPKNTFIPTHPIGMMVDAIELITKADEAKVQARNEKFSRASKRASRTSDLTMGSAATSSSATDTFTERASLPTSSTSSASRDYEREKADAWEAAASNLKNLCVDTVVPENFKIQYLRLVEARKNDAQENKRFMMMLPKVKAILADQDISAMEDAAFIDFVTSSLQDYASLNDELKAHITALARAKSNPNIMKNALRFIKPLRDEIVRLQLLSGNEESDKNVGLKTQALLNLLPESSRNKLDEAIGYYDVANKAVTEIEMAQIASIDELSKLRALFSERLGAIIHDRLTSQSRVGSDFPSMFSRAFDDIDLFSEKFADSLRGANDQETLANIKSQGDALFKVLCSGERHTGNVHSELYQIVKNNLSTWANANKTSLCQMMNIDSSKFNKDKAIQFALGRYNLGNCIKCGLMVSMAQSAGFFSPESTQAIMTHCQLDAASLEPSKDRGSRLSGLFSFSRKSASEQDSRRASNNIGTAPYAAGREHAKKRSSTLTTTSELGLSDHSRSSRHDEQPTDNKLLATNSKNHDRAHSISANQIQLISLRVRKDDSQLKAWIQVLKHALKFPEVYPNAAANFIQHLMVTVDGKSFVEQNPDCIENVKSCLADYPLLVEELDKFTPSTSSLNREPDQAPTSKGLPDSAHDSVDYEERQRPFEDQYRQARSLANDPPAATQTRGLTPSRSDDSD